MTPGDDARWDFHLFPESQLISHSRKSELAMLLFVPIHAHEHVVPCAARF